MFPIIVPSVLPLSQTGRRLDITTAAAAGGKQCSVLLSCGIRLHVPRLPNED